MAVATENLLKIGDRFGIYDVVRELGHGGMGAVYLVRDPETGQELAAKVMYPESPAVRAYFVKRFIREAEIAMSVRHPNLIRVYDVGRDPDTGLGYMLMDYVPGGSLKDRLMRRLVDGKGPFPVQEALQIVRQVAGALAAAAEHGIVHRDVKPDNILFDTDGTPKLADLGVAKVSDSDVSTQLTMSSVVVGTPAYMAPEQMTNSHAVDARADIYSLGIVLWEILAGERPTAGISAAELMARAVRGERIPDIRTKRKGLPPHVIELIQRMTEPKVERRIASPEDVIRFIAEWRERAHRRMMAWLAGIVVVGGLLLATVLGVGVWYIVSSADERRLPDMDFEIKTASTAPTLAELAAGIEEGGGQEHPAPGATAEAAAPTNAVLPAAEPGDVPPAVSNVAQAAASGAETTLEGLLEEFGRIVAGSPEEAARRIGEAINAARHIDPDLNRFDADGRSRHGGPSLSAEDAAVHLRGIVFLKLELLRRKNARLPDAAGLRELIGR